MRPELNAIFFNCAAVVLGGVAWVGRGAAAGGPATGVTLPIAECGDLLSGSVDTDCRTKCRETGQYDPQLCYMSRVDGKAANCSLPWALDSKLQLATKTAEDLASCQQLCQAVPSCALFEFNSTSGNCILRSRSEHLKIARGYLEGAPCSSEFQCNALFDSECPLCFGRRICMRREDAVFLGPRECFTADLKESDRCIAFGYPWPLTSYVVPPTETKKGSVCASELFADAAAAPSTECHLALPGTSNDGWLEVAGMAAVEKCVSATFYVSSEESPGHSTNGTDFPNCLDLCRANSSCIYSQYLHYRNANWDSGSCRQMGEGDLRKAVKLGTLSNIISHARRCVAADNPDRDIDLLVALADPGYDAAHPLASDLVRPASVEICERLLPKHADAAGGVCQKDCYGQLGMPASSFYNKTICAEGVAKDYEPMACVTHFVSASTKAAAAAAAAAGTAAAGAAVAHAIEFSKPPPALHLGRAVPAGALGPRGGDSGFLSDTAVNSFAQCANACLADARCAVWEVYRVTGVGRCRLKTKQMAFDDVRGSGGGGGAGAPVCLGQQSGLAPDAAAFRGAAACALPYTAIGGASDAAHLGCPSCTSSPPRWPFPRPSRSRAPSAR